MLTTIQRPYDSYLPEISRHSFQPLEDPSAGGRATASPATQEPLNEFKTDYDEPRHSSCQKLLFSATLTSDPGKVSSLGLRDPKYFVIREAATGTSHSHRVVSEDFSIPTNLVVGFHIALVNDFSQVKLEGTHDRVQSFPETADLILSCTHSTGGQRSGLHQILGIHRSPRQAFRAVREKSFRDREPEAHHSRLFE